MTKEKQQITIAKACGWKDVKVTNHEYVDVDSRSITYWSGLTGIPPEFIHYEQRIRVPDYLNDLNAMHEAIMTRLQGYEEHFRYELSNVVNDEAEPHLQDDMHYIVNATAKQRAKALLKVLNLWEDSK